MFYANKLGMKALPKILLAVTAVAVTSLFSVQPAQAYTVTLEQIGANVVGTGSGALNFIDLNFNSFLHTNAQINPSGGTILTGLQDQVFSEDIYTGSITGPTSFGSGGLTNASSGSGFLVGINGALDQVFIPGGITTNQPLPGSATWNNATFASLGLTPGTYTWTWGTGLPNQNYTLIIGGAGVPDGGSTVSLLGFAMLGLAALRRKLSC
jgi:hypothetical protein